MGKHYLKDMKGFVFIWCLSSIFLFTVTVSSYLSHDACAQEEGAQEAKEEMGPVVDNTIKLPLKSVMVLAIKNNLQIAFESFNPKASETGIAREEGMYDPNLSLQYSKDRKVTQVGNILQGAGQDTVYQENYNLGVDVTKKFVSGTSAELKWNSIDSKTDFSFQTLVPQYKSELNLSLVQPLLKDFGIDIGRSMIKIANLDFKISNYQFENQVITILYQIQTFYWNLFFQIKDIEAREKSVKAAEDLLKEFKIKIEAGTLAPIEIYQAEAEVAERKQELIVARDLVRDTEDKLKSALNFYEKEQYWDLIIIPADEPRTTVVKEELMGSMKEAFENRPDYLQAKTDIEARNIMVKYTKNQTLPRVDVIGTIGTMGLGGRTNPDAADFMGGGSGQTIQLSRHWDDVADSMGSGDYYNYIIGMKIEFPLGNRTAKSQYSKAKIGAAQAATLLKDLENNIINEVREAVRQIETNIERVEAAKATRRLAEERLKAEGKKFEVGLSTAHDLLEFQDELAKAESREAFSRTEYEKSIADLSRVKGIMLRENDISIN